MIFSPVSPGNKVTAWEPGLIARGELIASLLIVLVGAVYCSLYFQAMSSTSLWNDELYSILFFSSQGALTSVTDYHVPNNHIFFNVLNSLTPNAGSYHPLRARLWSFVFILAAAIYVLSYFYKRGWFLEGSVLFFVAFSNPSVLDLGLQARGYGFLFLCALSTTLLYITYIGSEKLGYLLLIGLLTVLGTWAIPTYIFFPCFLLLLTLTYNRSLKVFWVGAGAFLCVVLLYLPVLDQLLYHAIHYSEKWGKQYASVTSVVETIRQYLFPTAKDWFIFIFLFLTLVTPSMILRRTKIVAKNEVIALEIISASAILFFTVCLFMETPAVRTTSFIVFPILVVVVFVFSIFYRRIIPKLMRLAIYLPITVWIVSTGYTNIKSFSFTPIESWMEVARIIERTLPDTVPIYANFSSNFLEAYLDDRYELADHFDKAEFLSGRQIIVDSEHFKAPDQRFNVTTISNIAAQIAVPQIRGAFQRISFMPASRETYIERIHTDDGSDGVKNIFDRIGNTRWTTGRAQSKLPGPLTLEINLKTGQRYRSLVLVSHNNDLPASFDVYIQSGNAIDKLAESDIYKGGDSMIVFLGDRKIDTIKFIVRPYPTDRFFSINEAWLYRI